MCPAYHAFKKCSLENERSPECQMDEWMEVRMNSLQAWDTFASSWLSALELIPLAPSP